MVLASIAVITALIMAPGVRAASTSRIALIVPGEAASGGVMPALDALLRPTGTAAATVTPSRDSAAMHAC